MTDSYKRQLTLLLLIAAIVLAAGIGLRDPWPADEPRFALIAKDMVESGSWLLPHVGGVLYPDKPPLFFWLIAALYAVTGSIRVAFLLPGMLAGLGVLALVTDLGRRLWNPVTGIWCGITLLAIFQFPYQMKMGQIDGLLCLWTTLGVYGFTRHLLLGPDWRWYGIAGLAAGLGVITKGVGILPYLIFLPYLLAVRKDWPLPEMTWRDSRWLIAPLATVAVIAAWLVPMMIATSGNPEALAYRNDILFHQTVTRYAQSWGHIKPAWYLFTNAIPWLWMPISLLLPWLIPSWWRDIRQRHTGVLLLGGWILLVLVFFSLTAGKRSLYIFPAVPALALVAGYHTRRLLHRIGVQRLLVAIPIVFGVVLINLATFALMNPHIAKQWLIDVPTIFRTSASIFVMGIIMLTIVAACRRRRVLTGFATAMVTFWLGFSLLVAPAINGIRSGASLIEAVEQQVGPAEELAFAAWPEQFLLQGHRPVTHFGYRREINEEMRDAVSWLTGSDNRRLLLPDTLAWTCLDPAQVTAVGRAHRRNWILAAPTAVKPACQAGDESTAQVISYTPVVANSHAGD